MSCVDSLYFFSEIAEEGGKKEGKKDKKGKKGEKGSDDDDGDGECIKVNQRNSLI